MSSILPRLLDQMHKSVEAKLEMSREVCEHPVARGDATERVWLDALRKYLPARYRAKSAFVVDSRGEMSQQIDVVIFDRQYSPLMFKYQGYRVIPAESVYAVLEVKQTLNREHVQYAGDKVASVRRLHRTSLPIVHASGVAPAKPPFDILGGLLTFKSDWTPPLGQCLTSILEELPDNQRLQLGCVAAHGTFGRDNDGCVRAQEKSKPATAFLFELIIQLQKLATVPMLDISEYARWLDQ